MSWSREKLIMLNDGPINSLLVYRPWLIYQSFSLLPLVPFFFPLPLPPTHLPLPFSPLSTSRAPPPYPFFPSYPTLLYLPVRSFSLPFSIVPLLHPLSLPHPLSPPPFPIPHSLTTPLHPIRATLRLSYDLHPKKSLVLSTLFP